MIKGQTMQKTVLRFVLEELGLIAVILLIFALFHHVLPIALSKAELRQQTREAEGGSIATTPIPVSVPEPTVMPEEATPEPRFHPPENATAWQLKFAEHFTDEVEITDHSYTSPNLSVEITTHNEDLGSGNVRWYFCDIYVASLSNFRTAFAYNMFKPYLEQDILTLMSEHNAILAMSGDSCLRQYLAFVVRNGYVYSPYPTAADYLVMFADGSMKVCVTAETDVDALVAGEGDRQLMQSWHFGPSLLDENGKVPTEFASAFDQYVLFDELHPRCGIGYYEPGHYCLLLAEGRLENSVGLTVRELAELFEREGCSLAYNLDGGRTCVLGFNAQRYSVQSNGARRLQNDIIYLADVAPGNTEEGQE